MRIIITSLLLTSQLAASASAQPNESGTCPSEGVSVSALSIDARQGGNIVYEEDVRIELQGMTLKTEQLRRSSVSGAPSQQGQPSNDARVGQWCNPANARFEAGEIEFRGETLRVLSGGVTFSLDGSTFEADEVMIMTKPASS